MFPKKLFSNLEVSLSYRNKRIRIIQKKEPNVCGSTPVQPLNMLIVQEKELWEFTTTTTI